MGKAIFAREHSPMRTILIVAVILAAATAIMILPAGIQGQQTAPQPVSSAQAPAPQQDSLAAAARKAREQKKDSSKTGKVFTNDNIPTSGGISSVGDGSLVKASSDATSAATTPAAGNDEKAWRAKFVQLRQKLDKDKADLDIMQRELGLLDVQYYNDPVKAMQQQLSREDINKKIAEIETKKKDVAADQQAIDDAEDDLRKAGGDPGWAR
jgi:hypothetical protein